MRRYLVLALAGIASTLGLSSPAYAVDPIDVRLPAQPKQELEPNGTPANATPLSPTDRVRGDIGPGGDVDVYSFQAAAGDRVYAATMTAFSAIAGLDSDATLEILASDGTAVVESDQDDGSFTSQASSIAGATIPASGTYYLRVSPATGTQQVRPYDLYVAARSGTPIAEIEPNGRDAPQALPGSRLVAGTITGTADADVYSIDLGPGDTVYASLDLDPERDGTTWNALMDIEPADGSAGPRANDFSSVSPNSEANWTTTKSGGPYRIVVASGDSVTSGSYTLSVTVVSAQTSSCRVYDSAGPVAIPNGSPPATSSIAVPDDFEVSRAAVALDISHPVMSTLDVWLQSPAQNEIAFLTNTGSSANGFHARWDLLIDDAAAITPTATTNLVNLAITPEPNARTSWLSGERAAGTWTLNVGDDQLGNTGTLNSWRLILCGPPPDPAPSATTLFSTGFDADDGGFTHSGTADEWERGLPSAAPITNCAGGSPGCWKTDLDGAYDDNSSQDLVSPPIAIPAGGTGERAVLSWAQRYQMERAEGDHYWVEVREAGQPAGRHVFDWTGARMTENVASPSVQLQMTAGWGTSRADISDFLGKTVEVVFHLDSDANATLPGVAIDDVQVRGPAPPGPGPGPGPGGGGSTGQGPTDGSSTPDTTAPGFRLSARSRQKAGKTVNVVVAATTEDLRADATGTVSIPGVRKVGTFRIGSSRNKAVARGRRVTLKLKVPPKVLKAVRKALARRKRVSARVTLTARDAAGNRSRPARRTIRLTR